MQIAFDRSPRWRRRSLSVQERAKAFVTGSSVFTILHAIRHLLEVTLRVNGRQALQHEVVQRLLEEMRTIMPPHIENLWIMALPPPMHEWEGKFAALHQVLDKLAPADGPLPEAVVKWLILVVPIMVMALDGDSCRILLGVHPTITRSWLTQPLVDLDIGRAKAALRDWYYMPECAKLRRWTCSTPLVGENTTTIAGNAADDATTQVPKKHELLQNLRDNMDSLVADFNTSPAAFLRGLRNVKGIGDGISAVAISRMLDGSSPTVSQGDLQIAMAEGKTPGPMAGCGCTGDRPGDAATVRGILHAANQLDLVDSIWNTHEQFKSVGSAVYNTLAPTLEACYLPRSASPYYAESSGCESLNRAYSALVLGQSTKRNGGDWATSNAHRHVPKHELLSQYVRVDTDGEGRRVRRSVNLVERTARMRSTLSTLPPRAAQGHNRENVREERETHGASSRATPLCSGSSSSSPTLTNPALQRPASSRKRKCTLPTQEAGARTEDYASAAELRSQRLRRKAPCPLTADHASARVGLNVMVEFEHDGVPTWFCGRITSMDAERGSVVIFFPKDGDSRSVYLHRVYTASGG